MGKVLVPQKFILPLIIIDIIATIASIFLEPTVIGSVIADIIAGLSSLLVGDYIGFVLSVLAIIPVVGSGFGIIKIFYKIFKIAKLKNIRKLQKLHAINNM